MGGEGHRWFGRREPRVELAPRYKMHGRFPAAKTSSRFTAQIDELFDLLRPGADELAAILCHARAIGATLGPRGVAPNIIPRLAPSAIVARRSS